MGDEIFQAINDNSPIIAWIHNISLNQQKYLKSKIKDYDFGHNVRYLMFIYDNPNCSQEDLVNMFCQSKGNIAKILKKFEDGGYIKREINPQNRRKYMLNTTDKANELIPEFRQISKDWDRAVGLTDEDEEFKNRLREIAINGMELLEDSQ
ncbi:MarR family winged helix-turn-helix transcriptional regulator [uncultured Methanobrevibacter sp.]|uniref:MarR family winged helix-turn-helix transcriptional regulator n=1 Tax=uncultured Methanobrevibacter sp. TaxID=253161 RepID=UPI0025FCEACD|nr:MarR family winged helix-turn-helix transcriptional regulator [uncultured Methanobrevibacter sp.]